MQEQLWPNLWYNIICIVWLKKMENLSQESPLVKLLTWYLSNMSRKRYHFRLHQ